MKTYLSKWLAAVLLFASTAVSAESIIETMIKDGPTVRVCNSFALAYADGIYAFGEGHDSMDTVAPHPELNDPDDQRLWRELQAAGLENISERWAKMVAQAQDEKGPFEGKVTVPDREVAKKMAQGVYGELEKSCNATRDLTVIKLIPNLGDFTKRIINLIEAGPSGTEVNFIKVQNRTLDENEHYGLEWQIVNGLNYLGKWFTACMEAGGTKSVCKAEAWSQFFDYTKLYPQPTVAQCIDSEI